MALSDSSLTELVAELRQRLRHFVAGPPGLAAAATVEPGPLSPAGRAALAARLLAVALEDQGDAGTGEAAAAFTELATVLSALPTPLPGSELEAGLGELAREFEDLAAAWDRGERRDLAGTWDQLRSLGDRLWPREQARAAAPVPGRGEVWLLTAGVLRRTLLRRRLEAAGLRVTCLADTAAVVSRLADERPVALVCDDAAPTHHCSRLLRALPAAAPRVIQITAGAGAKAAGVPSWSPPYRPADILALLAD